MARSRRSDRSSTNSSAKTSKRQRSSAKSSTSNVGKWFLGASAVGALNTINARKPFAREGRVSVPSFFTGWLTSELPLHAIGWQALGTAGFIKKGALKSPAGWLGLGLSAASWAGLYKVWQESMGQNHIFEEALVEALGSDADEGSSPLDPNVGPDPVVTRQRIASGPLTQWKKRYVSGPAISYGDAGRRNELDIWARPDLPKDGKAPVLLQVHGGAWVIGNKDQQAMPLMAHMADSGWVCVAINYRLSPRATWPDHIVDVKRAIAWIKDNIAEYGGDPDFVAITGGSAGGHLCSLAALTPNEAEFQPGFEDKDTSLVAAVPFYGVYDFTNRDGTGRSDMEKMLGDLVFKVPRKQEPELWDHASSMTWVNEDAPPFFAIHGTNDSLVPVEQARSFVKMLRDVSKNPVAYAELPGTQHAFEVFDSPRTIFSATAVQRFLEAIRHRAGHSTKVEDVKDAVAGVGQTEAIATADPDSSSSAVDRGDVLAEQAKADLGDGLAAVIGEGEPFPADPDAPLAAAPVVVEDERPGSFPVDPDSPIAPAGLFASSVEEQATAESGAGAGRIKGNRDSMKYHVPGSQWYDRTVAEEWFDTVEEAEAAGFEPAGGAARQHQGDAGD